jgi:hypothetical protein
MYAIWDAADPVVNFQSFIDDNDSIKDEVTFKLENNLVTLYLFFHQ